MTNIKTFRGGDFYQLDGGGGDLASLFGFGIVNSLW